MIVMVARARARVYRATLLFSRGRARRRSIIDIVGLQLQDAVVTIAEIVSQIPFVANVAGRRADVFTGSSVTFLVYGIT